MPDYIQATLSRLRDEFISRLPERLAILEELLARVSRGEAGAGDSLHREAHNLVGAAGIHRLMEVSEAARRLERVTAALPAEGRAGETRIFALHKALAQLAAAAEHPALNFFPSSSISRSMRILMVEDDPDQAVWLRSVLEETGYRVEVLNSLDHCREALDSGGEPAALIMDMGFPEGDKAGAEFIAEMKTRGLFEVPVIFLSARSDMQARLAAYQAGATRYLTKPVDREELLRTISRSAGFVPSKPYRVLLVDDDREQLAAHAAVLREAGMEVRETADPMEVPDILKDFRTEVLVLDMYMPQCTGPQLAAVLRDDAEHELIPIIYLSAETDVVKQLQALNQGGERFLVKPVEPRQLVATVNAHARNYRQSQEQLDVLRTTLYERERQQQALDAHAIVSVTDTAGNIIYANDRFCEVSGYTRQEILGKNHRVVKSGQHPPEFYAEMWRTITRGLIWHGELCNRRKDGTLYWVESSIVPFLDENGKLYQYISIRTDITAVKLAEERLRRSQAYANIGTWDWNIETGELFWSERIGPLFGYPEGKLDTTYENFLAAVHPDDRKKVVDAVNNCVMNGSEYNIEHRCVWPDGTVRWLIERGDVVRDPAGRPLHMLGVVQDITLRKQAELDLAESRKRLEEAQHLAMLGSWSVDLGNGRCTWSNEVYRIFGRDPATFAPSLDNYYGETTHPDDVPLVRAAQQAAIETLELQRVDHRILRPDGKVSWVHMEGYAELDSSGNPVALTGTIQDITERKEAEQELEKAKETAEGASRAKSEFLASMSHELRTPLNSILGFAQLFGMDPYLPEKTKEQAREIERAGQHLLNLVNDLIDLARIEAGKLELSATPVSVKAVINDSLALVAPIARERGIRLTETLGDGREEMVRADPTRLQQVLINLLANAIKYNRPQGTVQLTCQRGLGRVRIAIRDNGFGIPIEKQPRIFNAFDRLGAERGQIEGSGIGLVITRSIVEAMGGNIGFESQEGKGSTFWVEFPVAEQDREALPQPHQPAETASPPPAAHAHVLYVEDNPMNQRLMQQIFTTRSNLELRLAPTAESGLQAALADPPAIILMDINLPGMDGYAALAALRGDSRTRDIPVIAVSANAMKGDEQRGLEAGFAAYLTKPIDIPELFRIIGDLSARETAAS